MKDNKILHKRILVEHYLRSEGASMLTIYEAYVIERLASFMGKKNECWPTQQELLRICKMSLRQLKRSLKSLKDKKIINIKRSRYTNIYSFNEFWLAEADKFMFKSDAAESFINNNKMCPTGTSDVPTRPITPIYNKNKNNKEKVVDNFYEPAQNGEVSPLLKDFMTKH